MATNVLTIRRRKAIAATTSATCVRTAATGARTVATCATTAATSGTTAMPSTAMTTGGYTRWVRHYNDVLLVDYHRGYVVDVIRGFFY